MAACPVSEEMARLARTYVDAGIFSVSSMFRDALHVAVSVLTRQDVLVSWNYKHLANRRRRAAVHSLNVRLGLPVIEIVAPSEL